MATITVTLPEGITLSQGKQISFTAPCDSTGVTGIIINNVTYTLLKANGDSLETGAFISGALISVLIDLTNHKAYIQNNAEVGVQSDWDAIDDTSAAYIKNKPTISGGLLPQITVTVDTGSVITCTDGTTTLTGTSTGSYTFEIPNYGTWTVSATLNGETSSTESIVIDAVKIYAVALVFFSSTITVTVDSGSTVTCAKSGTTPQTETSTGTAVFTVTETGTYAITATLNGDSVSGTVSITASGQAKTIALAYVRVYGFTINEAESNPTVSVTYTDDSTSYAKGSSLWDTSPLFANIKPCLFKDGAVVGYLQRNDYTKFEDGTAADITSGNAGDVMVEIPKMAYYMEKSGDVITCKVCMESDAKTIDAKYSYLPFSRDTEGDRDKIYIGAYLGYDLSSQLRSLSGKTPTGGKMIGAFRALAQANGTGYQQLPFYQLTLLQILYIMKYGSLDSQTALGRGYVDGNSAAAATGGTNAKGFCFGETTGKQQMKIFGIEDFWGNLYQWIDGIFSDASWTILTTYKSFNNNGSDYLFNNASGNSANTLGYMTKAQGGTQTGFNIKTAAGSESTYYADNARLYGSCLPVFGGYRADTSNAGAFRLYMNSDGTSTDKVISARLCYI